MKNWLDDPKSRFVVGLRAKLMGKKLDVEKNLLENNERIPIKYGFFRKN